MAHRNITYEECVTRAMLMGGSYNKTRHLIEVIGDRTIAYYHPETLERVIGKAWEHHSKHMRAEPINEYFKWVYGELKGNEDD